jgi:hypothetical protein
MVHEWEAYSLDHTDERFGVGRNMVIDGRYKFEKYHRNYKSAKSAERMADCLNLGYERAENVINRRTED